LSGGTIEDGTLRSSSFGVQVGTVSAVLAGGGTLTKSGGGTVVLSGNNIYTGSTNINAPSGARLKRSTVVVPLSVVVTRRTSPSHFALLLKALP